MGNNSSYLTPDHDKRAKIFYNSPENREQRIKENELRSVINEAVKSYNSGCISNDIEVKFPNENAYCDKLNEILEGKVAYCEIYKAHEEVYIDVFEEVGDFMYYRFHK